MKGQQVRDCPTLSSPPMVMFLDDQIGFHALDELVRAVPLVADADLIPLVSFQEIAHQLQERGVVGDERDVWSRHSSSVRELFAGRWNRA